MNELSWFLIPVTTHQIQGVVATMSAEIFVYGLGTRIICWRLFEILVAYEFRRCRDKVTCLVFFAIKGAVSVVNQRPYNR